MRRVLRAGVAVGVLALLVAAVASGGADKASQSSTTLVFGAAADPVVLDAALISDGESFRVVYQITETLVGLKPGTTQLAPHARDQVGEVERRSPLDVHAPPQRRVPRRHAVQRGGGLCELQPLVQLQGRAAVARRRPTTTTYVFGGFKTKDAKGALYRNCQARGSNVAVINLKRPYGPFLAAMTLSPFAIQSPTSMRENGADRGRLTSDGVYQPLGDYGVPGGETAGTGSVQAGVVARRRPARAVPERRVLGPQAEPQPPDLPGDPRQRSPAAGAPDRGDRRVRPGRAAGHQHDQARP